MNEFRAALKYAANSHSHNTSHTNERELEMFKKRERGMCGTFAARKVVNDGPPNGED
jgi:hypothetical protein